MGDLVWKKELEFPRGRPSFRLGEPALHRFCIVTEFHILSTITTSRHTSLAPRQACPDAMIWARFELGEVGTQPAALPTSGRIGQRTELIVAGTKSYVRPHDLRDGRRLWELHGIVLDRPHSTTPFSRSDLLYIASGYALAISIQSGLCDQAGADGGYLTRAKAKAPIGDVATVRAAGRPLKQSISTQSIEIALLYPA
jgi:hypothetical protein